jgi:hypothetical protein
LVKGSVSTVISEQYLKWVNRKFVNIVFYHFYRASKSKHRISGGGFTPEKQYHLLKNGTYAKKQNGVNIQTFNKHFR